MKENTGPTVDLLEHATRGHEITTCGPSVTSFICHTCSLYGGLPCIIYAEDALHGK